MIPPPPPGLRDVPEAELIRRFRAGGRAGDEAYSALVERHQGHIVRLVGYLLGSFADAEDIAQEAFVRGFMSRDSFTQGDNFRAWLRTIATRVAFNYRRDTATRARYHAELDGDGDGPTGDRTELRDLLERVLSRLSYAYREILVLRYVEEMTLGEIGEVLNLGESAAKMRLLRAREEFWALNQQEA